MIIRKLNLKICLVRSGPIMFRVLLTEKIKNSIAYIFNGEKLRSCSRHQLNIMESLFWKATRIRQKVLIFRWTACTNQVLMIEKV